MTEIGKKTEKNRGYSLPALLEERNIFVTEIQNIPYFDGHCDTIWRCMKREAVPDYGATEDECRAYFSACAALRENRGHVDLLRGQHYRKRAQFFALYDDVRALPPNTAWTKLLTLQNRRGGGRCSCPTPNRRALERRGGRPAGLCPGSPGNRGLLGRPTDQSGLEQRQCPLRLLRR